MAVATPHLKVADVVHNRDRVLELMHEAKERKAKLLVLPELTLTCYTASDLFFHDVLLEASLDALRYLRDSSRGSDLITVVGLPYRDCDTLYNTAAVIQDGRVLALIPKTHLPS